MGVVQNLQKFRVRYGSVTEHTEVPDIVARAYKSHVRYKNDIPVPGVFVALAYITSRSSEYGYKCPTKLTEVFRRVTPGVNTPGMVCAYPAEHNLAQFVKQPKSVQMTAGKNVFTRTLKYDEKYSTKRRTRSMYLLLNN